MVYLISDLHGDFKVFTKKALKRCKYNITAEDYVIVLGDFGLCWSLDKEFIYNCKWLSNLPFTILFISGNHDNLDLLESYPIEEWHGGNVHHVVRDKIIHLMNGQVFNIDGISIFTMGGAQSHDVQGGILDRNASDFRIKKKQARKNNLPYRIIGESYWENEIPSLCEFAEGARNLARVGFEVDVILTHCTPRAVQEKLIQQGELKRDLEVNALTEYFDYLEENVSYSHWFSGHIHLDAVMNAKHTVVYHDFVPLPLFIEKVKQLTLAAMMLELEEKYGNED